MTTRVGLLDYSRVATNNRTIYVFIYLEEVLRQHSKERSGRTVTHYYTVIHSNIIYSNTLYIGHATFFRNISVGRSSNF